MNALPQVAMFQFVTLVVMVNILVHDDLEIAWRQL